MKLNSKEYKNWILKYINNHDTREINFQNDVVKRLLERLYPNLDIVSVDTKGCDSESHNYYAYSGDYFDKGRRKPTTPDLLVCKNWDWFNKDNDNIIYIATIEVKSPYGKEAIYKHEFANYNDDIKNKIERHLSAEKINKVILTDTFKWDFFENGYENPKSFSFVNPVIKGRGFTYEWLDDAEIERVFDELVAEFAIFFKYK